MLLNLKQTTTLCLLFLSLNVSYAQQSQFRPKEIKYGKVDPEEFDVKPGGADTAAAAIAIFDLGKGYFEYGANGMQYVMERHTRYKIINKNGYEYANMEIQTYRNNGVGTSLANMEACTYNMEEGKIVSSKLAKDAKFTERQDKNYTIKKFALPNVKEGSVIEYKYTIRTHFIFTLRPWYFQKDIPTLHSEYVVTIPEYYSYKTNQSGFVHIAYAREQQSTSTVHHYLAKDVPGLRDESYVASIDDYRSKITYELASVNVPGEISRDYTSTWPRIVQGLKKDATFGEFIKKSSFTKTLLPEIVKGETDPDSIVCKIFKYVKNTIKWDGEHDLYTSENNPKTIIEKKAGNSADINLCLLILLNAAKIKAAPVLLSTRDNGIHPGVPTISAFNSVIIKTEIGEKSMLLDATDKHHSVDLIAYKNLNHEGLSIDLEKETSAWISLEKPKISGKAYSYSLKMSEDNKLSGKLYITSTDYEGLRRRDEYTSATNQSDFLKSYRSDKPGLILKNYEILNLDNPDESLTEAMDVEIEDNIEEGGNLAFFTPLLYEKTKENPFKLEDRKFPVDFAYPSEEVFRITIELPKNYTIDKAPKSEKFSLPGQTATFSFIFSQSENTIGLISKISIKKSVFTPEEYFDLKELFKNIVRKQAEQIVVKKS